MHAHISINIIANYVCLWLLLSVILDSIVPMSTTRQCDNAASCHLDVQLICITLPASQHLDGGILQYLLCCSSSSSIAGVLSRIIINVDACQHQPWSMNRDLVNGLPSTKLNSGPLPGGRFAKRNSLEALILIFNILGDLKESTVISKSVRWALWLKALSDGTILSFSKKHKDTAAYNMISSEGLDNQASLSFFMMVGVIGSCDC